MEQDDIDHFGRAIALRAAIGRGPSQTPDVNQATILPRADVDALISALSDLTTACEADFGPCDNGDEDNESVGFPPMNLCFGHIRRARAALAKVAP